jgi:hypothetical protein
MDWRLRCRRLGSDRADCPDHLLSVSAAEVAIATKGAEAPESVFADGDLAKPSPGRPFSRAVPRSARLPAANVGRPDQSPTRRKCHFPCLEFIFALYRSHAMLFAAWGSGSGLCRRATRRGIPRPTAHPRVPAPEHRSGVFFRRPLRSGHRLPRSTLATVQLGFPIDQLGSGRHFLVLHILPQRDQ